MKLKVKVGELRGAIEQAQVTCDPKIAGWGGMYLEADKKPDGTGELKLYTMKTTSKTLMRIAADVEEVGHMIVRPDSLLNGIRGHEGDSVLSLVSLNDANRLAGVVNKTRFRIALEYNAKLYRDVLDKLPLHGTNGSKFDATMLAEVLKRAGWVMGSDEAQPIGSLSFKRMPFGYRVQATDGHAAVRVDVNTDLYPESMQLPHISVDALQKMLGKHHSSQVSIIKGNPDNGEYRELYFAFANCFFGTATSAVKMPNIDVVFANPSYKPTHVLTISRSVLADILKRVASFADSQKPYMKFRLSDRLLRVSSATEDNDVVDELEILYAGDSPCKEGEAEVSVSYDFIGHALNSLSSNLINVGFRDDVSPLVITDAGNKDVNTQYFIMAVHVNNAKKEQDHATVDAVPVADAQVA